MAGEGLSSVSVVIPSVLRGTLSAALASVRGQRYSDPVEVVVVVDHAPADVTEAQLAEADGADVVLFTGGGRGAAHARNLGVQASRGEFVAFLDDDDEWLPDKLRLQVAAAHALKSPDGTAGTVVGSRVVHRRPDGVWSPVPVPSLLISAGAAVQDYLFRRRRASVARASFFTSTILASRDVAVAVAWDSELSRHQDWDWLIRAQRHGARLLQIPEQTVLLTVGSPGSISALADWRASLDWAERWTTVWRRATFVDFVAAQPLRYALQGRSASGARACARAILRSKRPPALGPSLIALGGLLPRGALERAMVRPGGAR